MDAWIVLEFVGGLTLLALGGEWLVRGAARLAIALGISPLLVGLTIVALGTSSPELAVSVQAGLNDQGNLVLGNVVGSNIINVLLILGFAAVVGPLVIARQLVRVDVPIMIGVSVLFYLLAFGGTFTFVHALVLLAGALGYTALEVYFGRLENQQTPVVVQARAARHIGQSFSYIVFGLMSLTIGSDWLVTSSVTIARGLGVSEMVIGLTLVALGTSLPELVTSLVASLRGAREIAVGNIVGSNIYNLTLVLGVGAMTAPNGIAVMPTTLAFDLPVMVAVAVACLPIFFRNYMIARWEGALFLFYYAAYLAYLFLATTQHYALSSFISVMLVFVIPLTVITFSVILARSLRATQKNRS